MTIVYIGLGSNLSDPQQQIIHAIANIQKIVATQAVSISKLYFSRPMGPQDQPDYMNAVISVETSLNSLELLDELQAIENNAGRIRKDNRWGARVLDLDILLFGNDIIENERLTVPHYGLKEREFVLLPLAEIAPSLILPDGDSIKELSDNIFMNGLKIHSELAQYIIPS